MDDKTGGSRTVSMLVLIVAGATYSYTGEGEPVAAQVAAGVGDT